jgi:hypothetical protein
MAVYNVHERLLPDGAGRLIDDLGQIWPEGWPRLRLDRPPAVGAAGGHGPIRYTVETYVPGEWVRFRVSAPRGLVGFHEFTSHAAPGGTVLRHTIAASLHGRARLIWPLAIRWLHDAMIEDLLDRAELATTGTVAHPSRWSPYVRLLRRRGGSSNRNLSERPVSARV